MGKVLQVESKVVPYLCFSFREDASLCFIRDQGFKGKGMTKCEKSMGYGLVSVMIKVLRNQMTASRDSSASISTR